MSFKVSVIIPAYNVEKYIAPCLESILNQSLKDIEIIAVNDGSSDKTADIIAEYAAKDKRITLINKKNGGQSSARNMGMEIAQGRFIYFMDADDILSADALESLYIRAEEENLDVCYFDGTSFYDEDYTGDKSASNDYYIRKNDYSRICTGLELFTLMQKNKEFRVSPCLQLIRKSLLDEIGVRFHEGIIFEDNVFSFFVIINAKRVSHINKAFFSRRFRNSSTTTSVYLFKHPYGYFKCFCDMAAESEMYSSYNSEEKWAVCDLMERLLWGAGRTWSLLSAEEKNKINKMEPLEKFYFETLVVKNQNLKNDVQNKKGSIEKANKKIKELEQNIQHLEEENSKRNKSLFSRFF